jgi:hypothetical protein
MTFREMIILGTIAVLLAGMIMFAGRAIDRDAWGPGAGPHHTGGQSADSP